MIQFEDLILLDYDSATEKKEFRQPVLKDGYVFNLYNRDYFYKIVVDFSVEKITLTFPADAQEIEIKQVNGNYALAVYKNQGILTADIWDISNNTKIASWENHYFTHLALFGNYIVLAESFIPATNEMYLYLLDTSSLVKTTLSISNNEGYGSTENRILFLEATNSNLAVSYVNESYLAFRVFDNNLNLTNSILISTNQFNVDFTTITHLNWYNLVEWKNGVGEDEIILSLPWNADLSDPSVRGRYLKLHSDFSFSATTHTGELSVIDEMQITNENIGSGDGSTTFFTLQSPPVVENSEVIYIDGTRTTDYTIDYETGEITFNTAPASGATITADYKSRRFYNNEYPLCYRRFGYRLNYIAELRQGNTLKINYANFFVFNNFTEEYSTTNFGNVLFGIDNVNNYLVKGSETSTNPTIQKSLATVIPILIESAIVTKEGAEIVQDAIRNNTPITFDAIVLGSDSWDDLNRDIFSLKALEETVSKTITLNKVSASAFSGTIHILPSDSNKTFTIREIGLKSGEKLFVYFKVSKMPFIPNVTEYYLNFQIVINN